jgi:hypothetical protein
VNDVATDREKGVRKIYNEREGRDDRLIRKTMKVRAGNEGMLLRCGVHGEGMGRERVVGGRENR